MEDYKLNDKDIRKIIYESFSRSKDENRILEEFPMGDSRADMLLVTKTKAIFFIDFRYFEKAKATVSSCDVVLYDKGDKGIYAFCKDEICNKPFVLEIVEYGFRHC